MIDYDCEDTPRFWVSQAQEKELIEKENERILKYDTRN